MGYVIGQSFLLREQLPSSPRLLSHPGQNPDTPNQTLRVERSDKIIRRTLLESTSDILLVKPFQKEDDAHLFGDSAPAEAMQKLELIGSEARHVEEDNLREQFLSLRYRLDTVRGGNDLIVLSHENLSHLVHDLGAVSNQQCPPHRHRLNEKDPWFPRTPALGTEVSPFHSIGMDNL